MMTHQAIARPLEDTVGAFCPHGRFTVAGAAMGPLAGLRFGAKDLFDIAGHTTGAGNPRWLETHEPARRTASSVQALLDAGASLMGKTITDELAYSLNGDNLHYGTPVNVNAPGRVPGGSSSGSAAAVAAGLCDFSLATDSGGSVRIPASFCGIYGIRPSHGRIPMDGVVPLMPSFDTVGWFGPTAAKLQRIGRVLLSPASEGTFDLKHLLILEDANAEASPRTVRSLGPATALLREFFLATDSQVLAPEGLETWRAAFRYCSAAETWRVHGTWINANTPAFAAPIAERFRWAESVPPAAAEAAAAARDKIRVTLTELTAGNTFLCLPSAPGPAPWIASESDEVERFRHHAQRLTCIASLAGLPQISMPAGLVDGCPIGLSLIGPRNSDRHLLDLCALFSAVFESPKMSSLVSRGRA
jgi:amidase